ncbi:MAG: FAD binding domain-containing protein [Thermaerobacter sp.]|nr:FAD binding domain-containing protein [Thermaerobacter sp.]
MKPCAFEFLAPKTLAEALSVLWQLVEEEGLAVKLLAGGQSLMPVLNMRLSTPDVLLDLNGLQGELGDIVINRQQVHIGALARHYQLETHPLIRRHVPVMAEAERWVGHVAIRSRGTIGGSLVHADPAAELPLVATLLDGSMILQSKNGCRTVPAAEFFLTYLMTTVEPAEILTEIIFPAMPARSGQSIEEFALRHGDFALAVAAAQITLDESGRIRHSRLALGAMGPTPLDMSDKVAQLEGTRPEAAEIAELMADICRTIEPDGDIHADGPYRQDLAAVLSARALTAALQRAQGWTEMA